MEINFIFNGLILNNNSNISASYSLVREMPYLVYNPQNVLKTKIISASRIYWDVKTVKNIVSHKGFENLLNW